MNTFTVASFEHDDTFIFQSSGRKLPRETWVILTEKKKGIAIAEKYDRKLFNPFRIILTQEQVDK